MPDPIKVVNLKAALGTFEDHWNPRVAGQLNGQMVKLARIQGEFVWHHHEDEDELFLVLHGQMVIELRDQPALELHEGEFAIIPRGVEHRPVAEDECHIMLFEPIGTLNTGNIEDDDLTRPDLDHVR